MVSAAGFRGDSYGRDDAAYAAGYDGSAERDGGAGAGVGDGGGDGAGPGRAYA